VPCKNEAAEATVLSRTMAILYQQPRAVALVPLTGRDIDKRIVEFLLT
jgi:hypothetical protein